MNADNWDQHWTEYAAAAHSNPAQAFRRRLIRDRLNPGGLTTPLRIIDLGSGQGDLAAELAHVMPEASVVGVEFSETGIEIASRKVPGAIFLQQDLLQPVAAENPYRSWANHAVCSEVLEHVDDPVLFLRNAAAFLEPACVLVVTVPGGPMSAFDKHIGHRRHFSAVDLSAVLEQAGYSVSSCEAAGFPFFNLYRLTVILRGGALVHDVSSRSGFFARLASRAMMMLFSLLFALNRTAGSRGWQTVAVARWKGPVHQKSASPAVALAAH